MVSGSLPRKGVSSNINQAHMISYTATLSTKYQTNLSRLCNARLVQLNLRKYLPTAASASGQSSTTDKYREASVQYLKVYKIT